MTSLNRPESPAFRASFLLYLEPQHRELCERLGELLEGLCRDLVVNDMEWVPELPEEVAAVVTDLRRSAIALTWIGRLQTASALAPADLRVAQLAADVAPLLERLIQQLGETPQTLGE